MHANIRALLVRQCVTNEGELLPFQQEEMELSTDGSDNHLMLIWPTLITHMIDERSPLYGISADDVLKNQHFEIVVMLEGAVESTGLATQARSSYLPSEILWGERFESMISRNNETGIYEVSKNKFSFQLCNKNYEKLPLHSYAI